MKLKSVTLWSAFALLAAAVACSDQKNPTTPSSSSSVSTAATSTASASGTSSTSSTSHPENVSGSAPTPVSPADGAEIKNVNQPVTLVVANAVTTGSGPQTYTFEVTTTTDAAFNNKVATKDGISPGANGQTSVTLDKLPPGQAYTWRAHLNVGGSPGPNSRPRGFTIGPQVTLTTPSPVSPANGSTVSSAPVLTTNNAVKQGPAGQVFYNYEIGDSASFGHILFSQTVPEGSGQTSVGVPLSAIPQTGNVTVYWHVQASDPSDAVTTPFSQTFSFVYQAFDVRMATFYDSPADLGTWPTTATITSVTFTGGAFLVDFDRRLGPNSWPPEPFGSGEIEYTLGMCRIRDAACSMVVLFWPGRELEASGVPSHVNFEWFYNCGRWGPLCGWQPDDGEPVGLLVASGLLRGRRDPGYVTCPRVCERSNVAIVPWSNYDSASYAFSNGAYIPAGLRRVFGFKQPTRR